MYWDDDEYGYGCSYESGYYGFYYTRREPKNYTHRPYRCQVRIIDAEGNEEVIEFTSYASNPTDAIDGLDLQGDRHIVPILVWPTKELWENFDPVDKTTALTEGTS